ncbi:ATP-binding protein [Stenotrophomonas sp. NPDC047960]|uniref:ATP-binding protein n=1 Tax=Stenotrophomonas sp. NPDC047960 TaxID=3364531 RepID=UPI00371FBEBC
MDLNFSGRVTRVVVVEEVTQVGQARREALAMADAIGFDEVDAGRVALAATELATNVIKHGRGGRMYLSVVCGRGGEGIELCTLDAGPGFSLAQSLPDGYSTGGTQGLGLGAIQRQATVLDAWSDDKGSVMVARIYASLAARNVDVPYGALRLAMHHEVACGDAWHLHADAQAVVVTLIDGLGHGLPAADAAHAGVSAAAACGVAAPADVIAAMHAGMSGTRGGAVAVARVEVASGALQFAGIGNISAGLHQATTTRGMASHPGIVGVQFRKAQPFHFHATAGTLLLMHSDGLQARWSLRDYPGLFHRHPALIVAVLQRDFDRGRDDTGLIALRLGDLH